MEYLVNGFEFEVTILANLENSTHKDILCVHYPNH